jgi:hypothetical protein
MKTYTAHSRTDADFAMHEFEADTPERALQMAREFIETNTEDLMFEEYNGGMPVNAIAISNDAGFRHRQGRRGGYLPHAGRAGRGCRGRVGFAAANRNVLAINR